MTSPIRLSTDPQIFNGNRAPSSFQQHLAILSLLLKGDHDAAADRFRNAAVQPDDFIHFVNQHRLQPTIFALLDVSPRLRQLIPPECMKELRVFSLKQWATQEMLVRELAQLAAAFAAAGQEFILLKGPYLAERFFGGIDRRAFWDLDILIKSENLPTVQRLLQKNGYTRRSAILLNEQLTARFTHAFDFVKPKVTLDLHWLLSANAAHDLDYEAIWRQRQTFVLRNRHFFVLSDEYEVVFKLISIFKDLERGAAALKQFIDLYFILAAVSRQLDWQAFLKHRKREKILRISVNILVLFLQLFDCQDRFPEMSTALAREQRLVKFIPSEYRQTLIEASPGALKNKLWAAGIYGCSRMHVFLWWLASLPFRLAVHDSGRYARFKTALQQTQRRLWARTFDRRLPSAREHRSNRSVRQC